MVSSQMDQVFFTSAPIHRDEVRNGLEKVRAA